MDRLAEDYPYKSPYDYAENNPSTGFDLDGLEFVNPNDYYWPANNILYAAAEGFRQYFEAVASKFSFNASATPYSQTTTTSVTGSSGVNFSSSVVTENKATFSFMPQNMFNYTGDNHNVPNPFSTSTTQTTKTEQKVATTIPVLGVPVTLAGAKSVDTQGTQKVTAEAGVGLTNKSSTVAANGYVQVVNTTTANGNSTTSAKVGVKATVPVNSTTTTSTTGTTTNTTSVGFKLELEKTIIGK